MRNKKSIWSDLLKETLPSLRKETLKASPCNVLHNCEKHFFQKAPQENQSRNKNFSHSQCWGGDVLTLQELLNIELFCHWIFLKIKTKNWDTLLVLLESPQGVGFYWGKFFVIFRDKTQEILNFGFFQLEISKIEWYSDRRLSLSFFNFKILSIDYNPCWTTPAVIVKRFKWINWVPFHESWYHFTRFACYFNKAWIHLRIWATLKAQIQKPRAKLH